METKRVSIHLEGINTRDALPPTEKTAECLKDAGELLKKGEIVAFPTETVYGLGANALNGAACQKIYAVKGRPADNPLIVHIASLAEVTGIVRVWPQKAEICARQFWPGPLTIVLPKKDIIPDIVSGGLDTVAVRMPSHPVALALIQAAGCPLAAPSANLSGKPSPTLAEHVWQDLNGKIPLLIDGGPCTVGLESTVLDLTGEIPVILRPGGITREQLEAVLGRVDLDCHSGNDQPKSPGMKYRHYAPEGDVVLIHGSIPEKVEKISHLLCKKEDGKKIGLLCLKNTAALMPMDILSRADTLFILGSEEDLTLAAGRLYEGLRYCDKHKVDMILAEEISEEGIGLAFMNRLRKAAGKKNMSDPAKILSRPDQD
ncbi:threonylcarbamoyl-AMP synthase [Dehalobacter sp. DCM]|uniref:L-threonylcarbamoyladenylate synthase n=1 Tax=Dehalobacter sp. DCM TaxID=2907827 RepID=UPI0030821302|nr:threonylcarbamoyl-AMP synthase [Dehalobacter sp. DCM]